MTETQAALLFAALSNADRLLVLRTLVEAGPDGMKAGDIATQIGASPSRASFHLAALSDAGLVKRERQSRSQTYRIDFDQIGGLMRFLLEDCCKGNATLKTCCGSN
ncbi:ArsR/SmtB family transcription factor [Shimia sp.]|uniref:ArsR/SmtB family transcription factor n=1 Tax=Shimia sp. TaxID=1954381 RepID=UPI003B8CC716